MFERQRSERSPRSRGRMIVEGLWSDAGEVLDLSAGGMRVRARRSLTVGQRIQFRIESARMCLALEAVCAWSRREAHHRWDIGLAFEDSDPDQLRVIGELALVHAARLEATRAA